MNISKEWLWDSTLTPIIITKTNDPYGGFLNMARGYLISYEGIYWQSSEALYQAHRFLDPEHRDSINKQINAYLAKQEMKRLRNLGFGVSEELWEIVKVPIMEMCLRLKFGQHPVLGELLMSTFPTPIVEYSTKGDRFWGCEYVPVMLTKTIKGIPKLVGKNTLGRLLMKLRGEFLSKEQLTLV